MIIYGSKSCGRKGAAWLSCCISDGSFGGGLPITHWSEINTHVTRKWRLWNGRRKLFKARTGETNNISGYDSRSRTKSSSLKGFQPSSRNEIHLKMATSWDSPKTGLLWQFWFGSARPFIVVWIGERDLQVTSKKFRESEDSISGSSFSNVSGDCACRDNRLAVLNACLRRS